MIVRQTLSELAADLMPFILQSLGVVSGQNSTGNTAGALLQDGSRPLLGNLTVSPLVTIDGIDISAIPGWTVGVSGLGLSGGGMIGGSPTIALTSSSNPGAAASILATDATGWAALQQASFGITSKKPYWGQGLHATRISAGYDSYMPTVASIIATTDPTSDQIGYYGILYQTVTSNTTRNTYAMSIWAYPSISAGATNSGNLLGTYMAMYRHQANDDGNLYMLSGARFGVGHYTTNSPNKTTTYVIGFETILYRQTGTITSAYHVLLGEIGAGTINNYWSVYSEPAGARMYHAGSVAIGTLSLPAKLNVLSSTEQLRLLNNASNYFSVTVSGAGVVNLAAVGTSPSIRTNNVLASVGYASQTTGLAADFGNGSIDARYIYTDEMHAKLFVSDLEQALAGGQVIAKSVAVLHLAFTAPAAGASALLVMRDLPSATGMAVFQNGDYIRLRTFARAGGALTIGDCWGTVTLDTTYGTAGFDSATKTQRYTFTRSASPNEGAMPSGTVLQPDLTVLDYGVSGNGIVETTAVDGVYGINAPYLHVATWTTHPKNMTERVRIGNLRGLTFQSGDFGLFAGEAYDWNKPYIRLSSLAAELNNLDLRLFNGTAVVISLSATGRYLGIGNVAPWSYTAPVSGMWVGDDGGTFKFRLGNVNGSGVVTQGLTWDGASLNIIGNGSGVTNIDGGNITTGTVTLDRLQAFERSDNLAYNSDFKILRSGTLTPGVTAGAPDGYAPYHIAGLGGVIEYVVYNADDPPSGCVNYTVRYTTPTNNVMGMMAQIGQSHGKSDFKWAANSSYLVSFYARCLDSSSAPYNGTLGMQAGLYWNNWPTSVTWISNPPLTGGWQRYVARVTFGATPESTDALYISFGALGGGNKTGDLSFSGFQIERCSATDTVASPYRSNTDRQRANGLITAAHGTIQATGLYATADHLSFVEMSGGTPYYRAGITNGGYFYLRGAPTAPASFVDFDPSTGKFRGGRYGGAGYTSPTIEWETDSNSGAIFAGGGRVRLGAAGMSLVSNVGYNAEHAIKFYDNSGTTLITRLYGFMEASTSGSFGTWMYSSANNDRKLSTLIATYNNIGGAEVTLQAQYIFTTNWGATIQAQSISTGSTIDLMAKQGTNTARIILKAPAGGGEFIDYYAVAGHFFREGQISLSPMTPPGTPNFGRVYIYVDSADNKLKAKGSSGTVTILANP